MSLLEMSVAGGCIILAAVLLRTFGKNRLPVWMFEALWALACLRLTAPARVPFQFSAWTLLPKATVLAAAAPQAVPGTGTAAALPVLPQVDIMHTSEALSASSGFSPWTLAWALGAGALAALLAVRYIRACRRFRGAETVEVDYVNQFLAEHPLRRRVSVRVSDRIAAPLTYGVVRPVILLPRSMDLENSGTLGYVLAHELAHIRRFDAARKLALAAVACLHWFDPLVWAMYALACRDMERACDGAVLRAFGPEARRDYAMALLDMEERRAGFAPGSGFSKNAIEERIHSIMKIRPRSFLSILTACALVLAVGAVFATAAPEDETVREVIVSQDGTAVYVVTDDGQPVSTTQLEYKRLTDPVEVEWWTAEEYAAWLEQEKEDLQDCLGQRAWTSADGWFTWTQEKIDETIEMYEQVLDEIEDGLLVSKTVDGRSDVSLMQGSQDTFFFTEDPAPGTDTVFTSGGKVTYSFNGSDGVELTEEQRQALEVLLENQEVADALDVAVDQQLYSIMTVVSDGLQEQLDTLDKVIEPYLPFGLHYSYDVPTGEIELYWNGRQVRGLYDGTAGVWITTHSGSGVWPEGTRELIAVYTGGELTGLRWATEQEQAQWDQLRETSGVTVSSTFDLPPAEPEQ